MIGYGRHFISTGAFVWFPVSQFGFIAETNVLASLCFRQPVLGLAIQKPIAKDAASWGCCVRQVPV